MKLSDLQGTWHLTSIYSVNDTGEKTWHFGKDSIGRLIYQADGNMTAFVMKKERPVFRGGTIDDGSVDEVRAAYQSFDAYSGTYTVNPGDRTVTHHVDMARSPAWVGIDLVRHFRVDGDSLSLFTEKFYSDFQGGRHRGSRELGKAGVRR